MQCNILLLEIGNFLQSFRPLFRRSLHFYPKSALTSLKTGSLFNCSDEEDAKRTFSRYRFSLKKSSQISAEI